MDKTNNQSTSDDKGGDANTNRNNNWSIFRSIWDGSWNVFSKRPGNKETEVKTTDENYLLHKACSNGDKETVELLLRNNAQINETDKNGDTPLFHAIKYGWKDIVDILLDAGADVNCAELGNTPLHLAAYNGYAELVKILIDRGANVNTRDMYGTTPLHWTVKRPKEIISPKETKNKKHVCYSIVAPDNIEIVDILLDNGADIKIANKKGEVPFFYAYMHNKNEIVEYLLNEYNFTERSSMNERDINLSSVYNLNFYDIKWPEQSSMSELESILPRVYNLNFYDTDRFNEILKKYVIKQKILGLLENKKDLGDYPFNMYEFQNKCQVEVESMKCAIINNTISIYQIATLCSDELEPYFRNEQTLQAFICSEYKTKFPIYYSMIKSSFRKGVAKRELLKYGEIFLRSIFQGIPHICCSSILSYLNSQDLKTLANVVKNK